MKTPLLLLLTTFCFVFLNAQPIIHSISPESGPGGTTIQINGNGFNTSPSLNIVMIGSVRAIVSSATATSLNVIVPTGAACQTVSVTNNALTAFSPKPFILTFAGGQPMQNFPGNAQYVFESPVDFPTDLNANDLAVADFNGDGKADVVTASNYAVGSPASVSVLKNTSSLGLISFATNRDLPTGQLTYAVAAGDLDGDGKPDLVSSSVTDKTISIFRNISSADSIQFAPKIDLATGNNPYSIAIADFDLDGKPDIVVANYGSNTISIYHNTSLIGMISFSSKTDFNTAPGPASLAVADFDQDGKTDVAISNQSSNSVSVILNTSTSGTISFAPKLDFPVGRYPMGIMAGDIDQDGLPELLVANFSSNSVSILRNTSTIHSIGFAAKQDYNSSSGPYSVSLGDVNGDGQLDIVVPGSNLAIFQNHSTPGLISLDAFNYNSLVRYAKNSMLCDFDGDGKVDLVGCHYTTSSISVCRNKDNEPSITSFTPSSAGKGDTVKINGFNLSGVNEVKFGDSTASSFTINSNSQIIAIVGNGADGMVNLSNINGSQHLPGFTFTAPPHINSFIPVQTGKDSVVVIRGKYFKQTKAVNFGSTAAASFVVLNDSTIKATIGNGTSGDVLVVTDYGKDSLTGFSFVPAPHIDSFSPNTGAQGTQISLHGNNLSTTHAISVGGVEASITMASDDSVLVNVGDGGFGSIKLTTLGGEAITGSFKFAKPVINSFSPDCGIAGSLVTISGSNFRNSPANNSVYFGNVQAKVLSASSTSLMVQVPAAATYGPVLVTTNGYSVSTSKPFRMTFLHDSSLLSTRSFRSDTAVAVGTDPRKTILVDLDGDGKSDLVTANYFVSTITAERNLSQNGKIAFSEPLIIAGSFGTNVSIWVTTADLDNDGKMDIIFTWSWVRLTYLKNTSTPGKISFAAPVTMSLDNAYDLVADDFDNDGRKDIAVITSSYPISNIVLLQNQSMDGKVVLAAPVTIPVKNSYNLISAADINGDGRSDLIVGYERISVLKNNSDSGKISFAPQVDLDFQGIDANALSLADLDGDGKTDIMSSNFVKPRNYSILRNISSTDSIRFESRKDFELGDNALTLALGNFSGDEKPDLVLVGDKKIATLTNLSQIGQIAFSPMAFYQTMLTYNSGYDAAIGDIDGDGRQDIAVSTGADNKVSILVNHIGDQDITVCAGADTTLVCNIPSVNYQWQVDSGKGFLDLVDNSVYSGSQTSRLSIFKIPISYTGFRYRCRVGTTFSYNFMLQVPTLQLTANGPASFCSGSSVVLSSSASSGNQWYLDGAALAGGTSQTLTASKSGTYTVMVSVGNCPLHQDMIVQAVPLLTSHITISYTGCATGQLVFTADTSNAGTNATIQWYVNYIASGIGATLKLNNPAANTKVYAVLSAGASCVTPQTNTSDVSIVNCTVTAIPEISGMEVYKIGPNPARDQLTVWLKFNRPKKLSIQLINNQGEEVYTETPSRATAEWIRQLDVRSQPSGVYLLKIGIDEKMITEKIIIIR
ncbi:MAG: FG-GAP-like repeat-containing protein [Flavisolibacter sp.]